MRASNIPKSDQFCVDYDNGVRANPTQLKSIHPYLLSKDTSRIQIVLSNLRNPTQTSLVNWKPFNDTGVGKRCQLASGNRPTPYCLFIASGNRPDENDMLVSMCYILHITYINNKNIFKKFIIRFVYFNCCQTKYSNHVLERPLE